MSTIKDDLLTRQMNEALRSATPVSHTEIFSRLLAVPDINSRGLQNLRSSQVAIVGVGGVGSAAAEYLARMGVGSILLVDQDVIEPSNVTRLFAADIHDMYLPKAEVIAEKLFVRYPWTRTVPVVETLRESNFQEILEGTDLIVDGLDNFRTRYIVNRFSVRNGTPYVFAGAVRNQGHVALFMPPRTPCLECVFRDVQDTAEESCESLGVTAIIVGMIGGLAANEAVQHIASTGSDSTCQLITVDLATPDFLVTKLSKRVGCMGCSGSNNTPQTAGTLSMLCGNHAVNILPPERLVLNLQELAEILPKDQTLAVSDSALVFRRGVCTISLFRSGRLIISGVETEEEALKNAAQVWRELVPPKATLT